MEASEASPAPPPPGAGIEPKPELPDPSSTAPGVRITGVYTLPQTNNMFEKCQKVVPNSMLLRRLDTELTAH